MIDVSMSNDDLFYVQVVLVNEGKDIFDVVAGIDHHGIPGSLVPDYRAVALQGADGKDFVNHGTVVGRQSSTVIERFGQRPTTNNYFCAGGAGTGAGVAGCVLVCEGVIPWRTEFEPLPPREAIIESVIEVIIKIMVDHVVALDKAVAAPRGPNAVWLPIPPKAAAISPLLPLCSSTTMIRKKQTIM
jgi:hypothetical protein